MKKRYKYQGSSVSSFNKFVKFNDNLTPVGYAVDGCCAIRTLSIAQFNIPLRDFIFSERI